MDRVDPPGHGFALGRSPGRSRRRGCEQSLHRDHPLRSERIGKNISGAVIRGERSLYSIEARSGQRLSVSISAEEDNAVFQIYAPGAHAERRDYGVEIVGAKALSGAGEGEDAKEWSGVLAETGTYLVAVGPTRGNATYTLRVAIH